MPIDHLNDSTEQQRHQNNCFDNAEVTSLITKVENDKEDTTKNTPLEQGKIKVVMENGVMTTVDHCDYDNKSRNNNNCECFCNSNGVCATESERKDTTQRKCSSESGAYVENEENDDDDMFSETCNNDLRSLSPRCRTQSRRNDAMHYNVFGCCVRVPILRAVIAVGVLSTLSLCLNFCLYIVSSFGENNITIDGDTIQTTAIGQLPDGFIDDNYVGVATLDASEMYDTIGSTAQIVENNSVVGSGALWARVFEMTMFVLESGVIASLFYGVRHQRPNYLKPYLMFGLVWNLVLFVLWLFCLIELFQAREDFIIRVLLNASAYLPLVVEKNDAADEALEGKTTNEFRVGRWFSALLIVALAAVIAVGFAFLHIVLIAYLHMKKIAKNHVETPPTATTTTTTVITERDASTMSHCRYSPQRADGQRFPTNFHYSPMLSGRPLPCSRRQPYQPIVQLPYASVPYIQRRNSGLGTSAVASLNYYGAGSGGWLNQHKYNSTGGASMLAPFAFSANSNCHAAALQKSRQMPPRRYSMAAAAATLAAHSKATDSIRLAEGGGYENAGLLRES